MRSNDLLPQHMKKSKEVAMRESRMCRAGISGSRLMVSDTPRETYIIPRRVAQATAIHLSVKIESRNVI